MIKWLQKLKRIVKNYDKDKAQLRIDFEATKNEVRYAANLIKERTSINVDVNFKERCQIVVIGRYHNTDYIQTYTINEEDFSGLIHTLKDMQQYGVVEKVDYIPNISAAIKREL